MMREFKAAGLELFLAPYGVVPTEYECGIIDVVPNAKSRAQLVSARRAFLGVSGVSGWQAGRRVGSLCGVG